MTSNTIKDNQDTKKHLIYKEAIMHFWKWFAYTVTTIALIIFLLFGLYSYDYHKTGEQCMKECLAEGKIHNCNGYCY